MTIPDFNNQGLLPPYNGEREDMHQTSPYPATTLELCQKFGSTPQRREILHGYLKFRSLLHQLQVVEGFQWVDGRFLEQDTARPRKNFSVIWPGLKLRLGWGLGR